MAIAVARSNPQKSAPDGEEQHENKTPASGERHSGTQAARFGDETKGKKRRFDKTARRTAAGEQLPPRLV
jgi:hypothetical protein